MFDFTFEGDILRYGSGDFDWVGFYSPVQSVERIGSFSFRVITEWGEYELQNVNDKKTMHVKTISGKDMVELCKEHLSKVW